VEAAKNTIVSLRGQERDTVGSQAQQASLDELYGLGYDFEASFEDRIRGVSLEQVQAIAKKYLTNPVVVTCSPLKRIASNGVISADGEKAK
jgi:zinc protease